MQTASYAYENGTWSSIPDAKLDGVHTLVLLFASPDFGDESEPFQQLTKTYPRAVIMGCSTAGEIAGERLLHDAVSVLVLRFECTEVFDASVKLDEYDDSNEAGAALARKLQKPGLKGVFLLSDGLHVNGSQLVEGMNGILGHDIVVTGGLAGDKGRFENTWVFSGGRMASGEIAAAGFYGESVEILYGYGGGWGVLGIEREVTRSRHNVLYELDGQPALALYKRYLGELSESLPASGLLFPLAVLDEHGEEAYVRTILGVNEAEQSIVFAGDIPEGSIVTLMTAGNDDLVEGADEAAGLLTASVDTADGAAACIAISCVGRQMVMKQVTEEELEAVMHRLPRNTVMNGFYSYGEIAPHNGCGTALHNQTMTLTLLRERPCTGS